MIRSALISFKLLPGRKPPEMAAIAEARLAEWGCRFGVSERTVSQGGFWRGSNETPVEGRRRRSPLSQDGSEHGATALASATLPRAAHERHPCACRGRTTSPIYLLQYQPISSRAKGDRRVSLQARVS